MHNEEKREESYYKAAELDVDDYITKETPVEDEEEQEKEKTYSEQLDEIDKLILEISGDQ